MECNFDMIMTSWRRRLSVATLLFLILTAIPGLTDIGFPFLPRMSRVTGSTPYAIGRYAEPMRGRIWQAGPPPPSLSLVIVSPPPGIGIPVGQYIGVRYYLEGQLPAMLEFVPEGDEPVREWLRPGQAVTHAWAPAEPGPHELRVRVLAPDGTVQESSSLTVIGLPAGNRVHVPRPFFRFGPQWFAR